MKIVLLIPFILSIAALQCALAQCPDRLSYPRGDEASLFIDDGSTCPVGGLPPDREIEITSASGTVSYAEGFCINRPTGVEYNYFRSAGNAPFQELPATVAFNGLICDYQIDGTLPIELTYFKADVFSHLGSVKLQWRTETELNNDFMEVERSSNGKQFKAIAKIKGAGTTLEPQEYSYLDEMTSTGVYYYRLRQVDFDGTSTYHATVSAKVNVSKTVLGNLYPNPLNNGSTTIELPVAESGTWNIRLITASGKPIRQWQQSFDKGLNTLVLATTDLPTGVYTIEFAFNGQRMSKSLIVQ
ncbi:MAG: T9SS type A sorting domain-containing protein [Bacteroidota bacterium]